MAQYAEKVLVTLRNAEQTKKGITEVLKEIAEIVAAGKRLEKLP
jgi:hypothetical protein